MDFLQNIELKKNTLTKNELKACEAICQDLSAVQHHSLTEMSAKIKITKTTILRFCQKMGYSGYTQFKYDCIEYVNSLSNTEDTGKEDTIIQRVEHVYTKTIGLMEYTIKEESLIALAKEIKKARRIYLMGIINSSVVCHQLHYMLLMFGIDTTIIDSSEKVRSIDMAVSSEDLFILISVGAQSEIVKPVLELRENIHNRLALITMNAHTPLEKEADVFILLPSVAPLKNKSLLDSVPIYSVFSEMLLPYLHK